VSSQEVEIREIQKVGNLIAAAFSACAEWALYTEGSPFSPEDVIASDLELHLLTDPKAKLLEKATGWKTVLFKASGPVAEWIPERMNVQISPDYLQQLKQLVIACINGTKDVIRQRLLEIQMEDQKETVLESEPIPDEPSETTDA